MADVNTTITVEDVRKLALPLGTRVVAGDGLLTRTVTWATVITVGRPELDLAIPCSIAPVLARARPDVIVNAAAYTAVDKAESFHVESNGRL